LARTGAIRVIYYALKRNVGFEHCEKLVRGRICTMLSNIPTGSTKYFGCLFLVFRHGGRIRRLPRA
jgi:hypothetical protein